MVIRHRKLITAISNDVTGNSGTEILTSLLVSLELLECSNCTSSSSQTMINRSPPIPVPTCSVQEVAQWVNRFRNCQHDAVYAAYIHHLMPYSDGLVLQDKREQCVMEYLLCAMRSNVNDITENSRDMYHAWYTELGEPLLEIQSFFKKRSEEMAADVHRCGCFNGCTI